MTDDDAELSAKQATQLAECERTIRSGLQTFVDVGRSLAVIRDGRLYRQTHTTFEAYCDQEFSLSRSRVYQMIDAATVTEGVSTIVDTPVPTTESQARELAGLDAPVAAQVMQQASATGGPVTAAKIRSARNAIAPRPAPVDVAESTAVETTVDRVSGEVLTESQWRALPHSDGVHDDVPAGFTADSPARVAADARREYMTAPWPVFSTKLLADLKRWGDWLRLPEIGPDAVVESMRDNPVPGTSAESAAFALSRLDDASAWIDQMRELFTRETRTHGNLRSVQ